MPTQIEKSRQSARLFCVSDADNDATDPVPIHWFPDPPGDETAQKPGEWKGCAADRDAEKPAARAQIRDKNE